jgi:hypothetical protein
MTLQVYRIGTSLTLGSLWIYSQNEGASQPYYDGRHWLHYQATTYSPGEAFNSLMSSYTVGKWHQLGECFVTALFASDFCSSIPFPSLYD